MCYDMEFWLNPQQHAVKRIPNDFVAAKWLLYWDYTTEKKIVYRRYGILLPKLFWPTVRKNCSSDQEKLLKFEAEGQEFVKILRYLTFYANSEPRL